MGRASRNFATFNKTVDDGWLAILTKNEQAVLSVYRRYVDPDGESYPGSDLIIKAIRHQDQSHLSRIRKKLVEYGLMEIIDAGGGRGKSVRVKLLYPKAPPAQKKREAKPCQNGDENLAKTLPNETVNLAKSEAKPCQIDMVNLAKLAHKPCQIDHLHNKEEQLRKQLNATASNIAGGIGGGNERGILDILSDGETDPQSALRELHESGQLPDWVLSGLPSQAANPEARFLIAKYFLNLRMNCRDPTPLSWRGQIGQMSKMPLGELLENLTLTIANNYVGLPRFGPKKTRDNGAPSNGNTEEFRIPERRRAGPSPPEK